MLKRILKNFTRVLRGRVIAAICAVSAMGLMAHALPVEQFGLVIVVHTYIMVIKGFLNFRTFEAIVRFGIPLQDSRQEVALKSLLRSTMMVDVLASLLATGLAMAAIPLAAHFLHWDTSLSGWASLYSLLLLSTPINTGSGILRLYDRFDALAVQYAVGPLIRVILVALAWLNDASMLVFLMAWGAAFCIGNLYMIGRGFVELRGKFTNPMFEGFRWNEARDQSREFWNFIGVVYWQTNVDLLPKHFSTLMAAAILGPAAAGLFRLAREISTILTQPAVLLREVFFPDLTRTWHSDQGGFTQLPFRASLIAAAAGLGVVVFAILAGDSVLAVVGADYIAAKWLMVLLLMAATFDLASAPLRAAVYAMGKASELLRIHILGIFVYILMFYVLTSTNGLNGPGLAAILSSMLTLGLTIRLMRVKINPAA